MARVAGGVYTSHVRDEGDYTIGLVFLREVIRAGGRSRRAGRGHSRQGVGARLVGLSKTVVADIEAARARGVEMFADQYPYNASSTSLGAAVLPGPSGPDARRGWREPPSADQLLKEVAENIRRRGGPAAIVIASGRGS